MREAMASAKVGDVGYDEDPSVNDSSSDSPPWSPSQGDLRTFGVMANQIAVRVLTAGDVHHRGPRPARGEFRDGRFCQNSAVQFALVDDPRCSSHERRYGHH